MPGLKKAERSSRRKLESRAPQLFDYWTIAPWTNPVTGEAGFELNVTLRPDARWQDGQNVTMLDVNYTLLEISHDLLAKKAAPPWWYSTTSYISALNIIDNYTAQILLNATSQGEGVWAAGWVLSTPIIPEHVWMPIVAANQTGLFQPDPDIVGTGPFIWLTGNGTAPGTDITLIANKPGTVVDHTTNSPAGNRYTSPGYYNYIDPLIIVSPSTLSIGPGYQSQGTISIMVGRVTNLYLWVFSISWNPAIVEFVSITEGPFLRSGGASTTGILVKSFSQTGGYLTQATCSRLGTVGGVTGSGILATITFRAKAPGASWVGLTFTNLLNSQLRPILPQRKLNGYVSVVRIPGDIDGDNQVTYWDVGIMALAYWSNQTSPNWNVGADLNYDGVVDYRDLFILARNY